MRKQVKKVLALMLLFFMMPINQMFAANYAAKYWFGEEEVALIDTLMDQKTDDELSTITKKIDTLLPKFTKRATVNLLKWVRFLVKKELLVRKHKNKKKKEEVIDNKKLIKEVFSTNTKKTPTINTNNNKKKNNDKSTSNSNKKQAKYGGLTQKEYDELDQEQKDGIYLKKKYSWHIATNIDWITDWGLVVDWKQVADCNENIDFYTLKEFEKGIKDLGHNNYYITGSKFLGKKYRIYAFGEQYCKKNEGDLLDLFGTNKKDFAYLLKKYSKHASNEKIDFIWWDYWILSIGYDKVSNTWYVETRFNTVDELESKIANLKHDDYYISTTWGETEYILYVADLFWRWNIALEDKYSLKYYSYDYISVDNYWNLVDVLWVTLLKKWHFEEKIFDNINDLDDAIIHFELFGWKEYYVTITKETNNDGSIKKYILYLSNEESNAKTSTNEIKVEDVYQNKIAHSYDLWGNNNMPEINGTIYMGYNDYEMIHMKNSDEAFDKIAELEDQNDIEFFITTFSSKEWYEYDIIVLKNTETIDVSEMFNNASEDDNSDEVKMEDIFPEWNWWTNAEDMKVEDIFPEKMVKSYSGWEDNTVLQINWRLFPFADYERIKMEDTNAVLDKISEIDDDENIEFYVDYWTEAWYEYEMIIIYQS